MPYYPPNPVIESVFYLATNGILLLRKKNIIIIMTPNLRIIAIYMFVGLADKRYILVYYS